MRGHIDMLGPDLISGWALDPTAPAHRAEIKVELAGKAILFAKAERARTDVGQLFGSDGNHGFRIEIESERSLTAKNLHQVEVFGKALDGSWHVLGRAKQPAPSKNQYQSFDDAEGVSKSSRKLAALRLNQLPNRHSSATPLRGLSVLDLGCNEGFFCGEALRQGAKRVVGIDAGANIIEQAKKRFPDGDFHAGSWWDLPDEKFDVIFFLSAIHYEANQRAFLDKLAQHLTPTGTLVLECGIGESMGKSWASIKRWDGIMRYPNHQILTEDLLFAYSSERVGPSVIQEGDPVPRFVYHCSLKRSSVLVFAGRGKAGASSPALDLASHGATVFNVDHLLDEVIRLPRYDWNALKATLAGAAGSQKDKVPDFGQVIASADQANALADLIALEAPLNSPLTVIEGEVLRHPALHAAVMTRLAAAGLSAWGVTPP